MERNKNSFLVLFRDLTRETIDWLGLINKSLNKNLQLIQTVEYVMLDFCHHQSTHYKYYNYEWKATRDRDKRTQFKILLHSAQFHKVCSKLFSRNAKSLAEQFFVWMRAQDILAHWSVLERCWLEKMNWLCIGENKESLKELSRGSFSGKF